MTDELVKGAVRTNVVRVCPQIWATVDTTDMEDIQELITTAIARKIDIERRHQAFGEIVKRFQDMAYGCAYAVLGDFQLAEDAAQEAFIAAYRDLDKLKDARAFPGWFRRIVIGESHRLMRGKHLPTEPIEAVLDLPSEEEGPAEAILKNELKDQVLAAIAALPENQRMMTMSGYAKR